ncbi:CPBP family intramembrane glutamic endopeptidase [Arenimonas sp.]|uniref:CPBP family intramembrane glutamic endopeptidase n=1 Tax=Arenimonas sp. TaxID=1872635 RepID=UPI0039E2E8C8
MTQTRNVLSPTIAVAAYAAVYSLSLYALSLQPGFSLIEPLFVLGVLGIAMPVLAVALTRNARNPGPSARPIGTRETLASLGYLALFALFVLGFGFSVINEAIADEPTRSLAKLGVKLATMVALPVALLAMFGHRWRDTLAPGWSWPKHGRALIGVGLALLAFQAVFGRGLQSLDALQPAWSTMAWAIPACFLLASLEAGLCEEVLFRVFLQTRLAAFLKSELGAIAIGSLLFGLAHAPGLYLRGAALMEGAGGQPTLLWSLAYSIAIISPAGILFGVLWSRTRSLALIVVLHGLTDTLPHLAPFIETWASH